MSVQGAFTAFLDHPERPQALALQEAVRAQAGFEVDTPWLDRARSLHSQARWDELLRTVSEAMPSAFLCPSAHMLLSAAQAGLGRDDESRREAFYAEVALRTIAATGLGTAAEPWRVLHVTDEYDVLASRGASPTGQRLVASNTVGKLDALPCVDGQEWFFLVVEPRE